MCNHIPPPPKKKKKKTHTYTHKKHTHTHHTHTNNNLQLPTTCSILPPLKRKLYFLILKKYIYIYINASVTCLTIGSVLDYLSLITAQYKNIYINATLGRQKLPKIICLLAIFKSDSQLVLFFRFCHRQLYASMHVRVLSKHES